MSYLFGDCCCDMITYIILGLFPEAFVPDQLSPASASSSLFLEIWVGTQSRREYAQHLRIPMLDSTGLFVSSVSSPGPAPPHLQAECREFGTRCICRELSAARKPWRSRCMSFRHATAVFFNICRDKKACRVLCDGYNSAIAPRLAISGLQAGSSDLPSGSKLSQRPSQV